MIGSYHPYDGKGMTKEEVRKVILSNKKTRGGQNILKKNLVLFSSTDVVFE